MKRAFTFPGQGSQAVGMGKPLAEHSATAREVFEEVDDALSQNLSKIIFEGPAEALTLTENTQPALMAVSLAVMRVLTKDAGVDFPKRAVYAAGHSLGEYSALCAAGAFGLSDTARLLKIRGQAMQRAVPVGDGAMAALLGVDVDQVKEDVLGKLSGRGEVAIANDNAPGQVVVSGGKQAVEAAAEQAKALGKKAVMLDVSAPFHCGLMQPAAEAMEEALGQVTIHSPSVPVVSNVSAVPVTDPGELRRLLIEQVTGRVRWRETVAFFKNQEIGELVEIGSGKVLSGLARRIDRSLGTRTVETPDDIDAFLKAL